MFGCEFALVCVSVGLSVSIDQLFHLDLSPISVVFPSVKILKCARAHWRHSCLIGDDGFKLRLFSLSGLFCFFYSLVINMYWLWSSIEMCGSSFQMRKCFCPRWWWLVVVKLLPSLLIGCNYIFLLILKPHWHERCLIGQKKESAID